MSTISARNAAGAISISAARKRASLHFNGKPVAHSRTCFPLACIYCANHNLFPFQCNLLQDEYYDEAIRIRVYVIKGLLRHYSISDT